MFREPAWPFLVAIFLHILSFDFPTRILASEFSTHFKCLNLFLYALVISISCWWIYLRTKKLIFSLLALSMFILIYGTTPRLINNFNNEALATLFLLVSSTLFYRIISGRGEAWASALLGLMLGLLALTKAQYLFIGAPLILFLLFFSRKCFALTLAALFIVLSPWIYRNYNLFNEPAIAVRGKTVAAVRVILTSEPTSQEQLCMVYAFTHPLLQHHLEKVLAINYADFEKGGKCQRLNRETCFDMGIVKVKCTPFPEDLLPEYSSRIQLFYKGLYAGQQIEKDELQFADIFDLNLEYFAKYIKTFPLFVWRGMGFSGYPFISIIISFSALLLLLTRYWSFSLLCVSSWLFHIAMTHNIPRYHAILFPVMILSFSLLIHLGEIKFKSLFRSKNITS